MSAEPAAEHRGSPKRAIALAPPRPLCSRGSAARFAQVNLRLPPTQTRQRAVESKRPREWGKGKEGWKRVEVFGNHAGFLAGSGSCEHATNSVTKLHPDRRAARRGALAASGPCVTRPPRPDSAVTATGSRPACSEAMQRGVDRSRGDRTLAAPELDLLNHRIPCAGPAAQLGDTKSCRMPLEHFAFHTSLLRFDL